MRLCAAGMERNMHGICDVCVWRLPHRHCATRAKLSIALLVGRRVRDGGASRSLSIRGGGRGGVGGVGGGGGGYQLFSWLFFLAIHNFFSWVINFFPGLSTFFLAIFPGSITWIAVDGDGKRSTS